MEIISQYIPNFLLILLRAGIIMSLLPFFGSRIFPGKFRLGFIVALALVLTPVIEFKASSIDIPILVMKEVVFGMALGLAARFVFYAIDAAGQVISYSMGLSMATTFNPEMPESTEITRLYGLFGIIIFLAADVHHDLIFIFARSYEWLPAGHMEIKNLLPEVVSVFSRMFVLVLKIGAPVIIAMLMTNLLLGFISKASPQMNVFFVGYPLYIFVGFMVLLASFPVFVYVLGGYFNGIKDEMARVIAIARG
jgi:flagellar biosynthesis protein FliR